MALTGCEAVPRDMEGLENAPEALRRLFTGENLGKQLVKIADPSRA